MELADGVGVGVGEVVTDCPPPPSGAGRTVGVAADVADADPPLLEAVTVTSSASPTSPPAMAYATAVAPGIAVQLLALASQRSHW